MFEKNLSLVPLFDVYSSLLSEHQQDIFSMYYNDDYSLSEISEQTGISRQGVRDCIKKCEDLLKMYEEKLGLLKTYDKINNAIVLLSDISNNDNSIKTVIESLSSIIE